MDFARFWRHVCMTPGGARRAFPEKTLDAIQHAIAAHEKRHRGEVVFIVEAELGTGQLWRGVGSRERAKEVFAAQGVWNTEENNGVLVYVLLADRHVEIVADRGLDAQVRPEEWRAICDRMRERFREGRFEAGAIEGVEAVSTLLERTFPAGGTHRDELEDRPRLL